jgi:signal transduction histidine kinase/tetratricopeptide (TPR) repeat protein
MSKKAFGLFLCLASYAVHAQDGHSTSGHPSVGNPTMAAASGQQAMPAALYQSLQRAATNAQKADACFFISKYFAERLKIDSALSYSGKIKELGIVADDEKDIGKYCLSRAFALLYRNIIDKGADTATSIFAKYRDQQFLGYSCRLLGKQSWRTSDLVQARKQFHAAVRLLTAVHETSELQKTLFELSETFYQTYEMDSAAFYLVTSLQLAEQLQDAGRIFSTSAYLGRIYLANGDLQNARHYLKHAIDICPPWVSKVERRSALGPYVECLMLLNDTATGAAIADYETITAQLRDNWGEIMLAKIKGAYQYHNGNYLPALDYLQQAAQRSAEIKNFGLDVKNIFLYLAKTEYALGRYDSAILHFGQALQIAAGLKFGADVLQAEQLIAQCYEKQGRTDLAYHYFMLYDHAKDSIMAFGKEKTVIELTAKYENAKKEQEIQLLQREKELGASQLQLKIREVEQQHLQNEKRLQELTLLEQQNRISRLEASGKALELESQQKEMTKKQKELSLLQKNNELQIALAAKEAQRKNFAYLAIAAILSFSIYVLTRYIRNRKTSQQLVNSLSELKAAQEQLIRVEKDKEAENVRVRISRDIHDEVGATLSGVALFSEIVRQKIEMPEGSDAYLYLDHITANSKEMIEKMSDIVWTINPQNDRFEIILARLRAFTVSLCAGKGIQPHFDLDESLNGYSPSMQVKKNVYLLVKEAVNNAVKYSEAKYIFLSIRKQEDWLTLEVRDDGKGFDRSRSYDGNGLYNMQARADDLQARLEVISQPGGGTSVRLRFLFHPAGGHAAAV